MLLNKNTSFGMSTNCATLFDSSSKLHYTLSEDVKSFWSPLPVNGNISVVTTPTDISSGSISHNVDVQAHIVALKRKFHHNRKLIVKHLPRNVIKQEIAHLLKDFRIEFIQLSGNDDKSSTATVTLENPEVLDEWNADQTFLLRGQSISVSPTPTEMMLCVAKLPFHFNESDFHDLIKVYGEIVTYFLMVSEKTGQSKGYGFVQYASKESALSARNALRDKIVDTFQLVCDWLDSSHSTFKSLHSTCLYVDQLPRQFRDMGEFRAIFEKIVKPPYCQIALRNGCPLDWGLVEYLSADDAELAQSSCNNYRLRNQPIRVVYFIPGVRAITLMLSLLDTPAHGKSAGLLPDPTGYSIRSSIENLSKQNPIFAENLKNIILHQIHESKQSKDEVTKTNGIKRTAVEPKTLDVGAKKHHAVAKDMEKIIPPTPPMTPTIVNTLPIMTPACVPSTVSVLPNTALPPPPPPQQLPCVDKTPYVQSQLAVSSIKEQYPLIWNDVANSFIPAMPPMAAATPDATAFIVPATPMSANFAADLMGLPLNMQQNILSVINASPTMTLPPPLQPTAATPVSFSPLDLDAAAAAAGWLLPKVSADDASVGAAAIDATSAIGIVPIAGTGATTTMLQTWPSPVATFVSTAGMPVFTTSTAAEWQNVRLQSRVIATPATVAVSSSSQPSTPVSHHPPQQYYAFAAGQKRKLLPSPEKSPEGNYIGQHSQGIGGHYADSYFKKKKMF